MGASMWDYIVPFQPRLETALEALRQRVFREHEYYFVPDDDGAWPATMEQLWSDEDVRVTGTHSTVIELHSRRLAGWAIADPMRTDLVIDALNAAQRTRGSLAGAIFHSDHGNTRRNPSLQPALRPGSGSR